MRLSAVATKFAHLLEQWFPGGLCFVSWLLVLAKTPKLAFHICQPAVERTVGTTSKRSDNKGKKERKARDW
jgi:hypothetical protein